MFLEKNKQTKNLKQKPHYLFYVAPSHVYLKDSRKKYYSEETVLKLEVKDLKLDLKLDEWVLVLKFMTVWAEAGAKVKWGGWGQVLVRRFACTNKSPFSGSSADLLCTRTLMTIGIVQAGPRPKFRFLVSHEVIRVNVSLNLGLTEWSGDVWALSGVSCAAGLFTLVSCSGEPCRAG